jgi:hypothetical protein
MTKFIEVSDQEDTLHYINIDHIVFIRKEHLKDTIVLSLVEQNGKSYQIKTQNNYEELKDLINM